MQWLKQSTAGTLKIGTFVDEDDGKTAETLLTIARADVRLSKNGSNMAQKTEPTSCTHDELGVYDCPVDGTDTDTLGRLQLFVHKSGALPVWHEYMVVPANVWDSFFGADYLHTNVAEISEDAAAANNAESFFDGTGYAGTNNVIPTVTTLTGHTAQSGDSFDRIGAPVGASISADVAAVKTAVDLNTLIISPVGGTTDGDGNVGGTTVLDSTRSEATNHWNNLAIEITSGACIGQLRPIQLYTQGVGFTVPTSRPFTAQIVSGITYRIVSAVIAQPGITVTKNAQTVVEPDGLVNIGVTIITANGAPPTADITPGTISIYRIRAGASTLIVNAAAASEAEGNAFYSYTFPSASWQAGDSYLAVMVGQSVIVNGTNYPLSTTAMQGYVTREIAILTDTNEVQTDLADDGRLDLLIDAIKAKTDNLPADPADDSDIDTQLASIQSDVTAILTDTGTGGVVLSVAMQQAIADQVLSRGVDNVEDTADAASVAGLILAAFESVLSGATWTIYKTDGATVFTTRTVTEDADAVPIVGVT
jgi:hypothetical protein